MEITLCLSVNVEIFRRQYRWCEAKESTLKIGSVWVSFYIYALKRVKGKQYGIISAKCDN